MGLLNPTFVRPGDLVEGDVITDAQGLPYAVTGVAFGEPWPYGPRRANPVRGAEIEGTPLAPIPGGSWAPVKLWNRGEDQEVRVLIRAWERAPYARAYGRVSGRSDAQVMFAAGALAVMDGALTW